MLSAHLALALVVQTSTIALTTGLTGVSFLVMELWRRCLLVRMVHFTAFMVITMEPTRIAIQLITNGLLLRFY